MALDSSSLTIIATVLNDAEKLLTGQPISVAIPTETIKVGNVSITSPAVNLEITYNK